jgi:hypothetical protein
MSWDLERQLLESAQHGALFVGNWLAGHAEVVFGVAFTVGLCLIALLFLA